VNLIADKQPNARISTGRRRRTPILSHECP
jgi:hypothetical protein